MSSCWYLQFRFTTTGFFLTASGLYLELFFPRENPGFHGTAGDGIRLRPQFLTGFISHTHLTVGIMLPTLPPPVQFLRTIESFLHLLSTSPPLIFMVVPLLPEPVAINTFSPFLSRFGLSSRRNCIACYRALSQCLFGFVIVRSFLSGRFLERAPANNIALVHCLSWTVSDAF